MPIPTIRPAAGFGPDAGDAVVLVTHDVANCGVEGLTEFCANLVAVDRAFGKGVSVHVNPAVAGSRLIVSATGTLDHDGDDIRRVHDAAKAGFARAKAGGAVNPVLVVDGAIEGMPTYGRAQEVAILGALYALYSPLQNREFSGEDAAEPVKSVSFVPTAATADADAVAATVAALEVGRRIARDITGADPERMSSVHAAEYVSAAFEGTGAKITIIDDHKEIERDFPCAHAVARSSIHTPSHHPRIVRVEYVGEGDITEQVYFSGKGIVYDTGGADIKAGGIMAGMKRDCGGAAAAAGFMRSLFELKPKNLRAVAYLGFVRNSVGSAAYVADEIITSAAGKRVLVVNTDAEGRMVMCDLLAKCKEEILAEGKDVKTTIHTIATLTGHAVVAMGPYSIAMDNGPAAAMGNARAMFDAGAEWADPFEMSTLRREDFAYVTPKRDDHDCVQCNNLPSSRTPRGHQFPMAFMILASGMDAHGKHNKETPIAYTHLDIAGSAGKGDCASGEETGAPVVALCARYAM